jgi:ankyrin repeat protein
MAAAAKGSEEMIRLILMNKTLDVNLTNEQGVNAFWIACLYGHG